MARARIIENIPLKYLVTIEEGAAHLGLSHLRSQMRIHGDQFPQPVRQFGKVRVWDVRDLEVWYSQHNRSVKRYRPAVSADVHAKGGKA